MSTIAIIAIVVAALIIIALVAFVLPRMRERGRIRARERELQGRRERVAGEHRAEAEQREREAAEAEQRARIAQREAEAQRAQAQLHEERAGLHERGMADHELVDDHERDRFAGTSAAAGDEDGGGAVPASEYRRGRHDEAMERDGRFTRQDDVPADEQERTTR
jgi:FtsZ-interacting cell division protein ZipA